MAKLSVTIITRNEEANIARTLESVRWADEIIVVDAESRDRTAEIARQFTEKVFVRPWAGFGPQRNFAIAQASHEWILNVDADEIVTPELADEVKAAINGQRTERAFYIPRSNQFCGRYLRYGGNYPDYQLRLFHRECGRFNDRLLHEKFETTAPIGHLRNPLLHWTFPDLETFFDKFDRVTRLGAQHLWSQGKKVRLSHFLFRPQWKFFKTYFLQQGFRDGWRGFLYASLSAIHIFVRYAKLWEIEHNPNLAKTSERESATTASQPAQQEVAK